MERMELLMLYSRNDKIRVGDLSNKLREMGIRVKYPEDCLKAGSHWEKEIAQIIANERVIAFFISNRSLNSESLRKEILYTYECAKNRDKMIIPIVEWTNVLEQDDNLRLLLERDQVIFPEDGLNSRQDIIDVAGNIYNRMITSQSKELLYEKIANLSKIQYVPGVSSNLSDLIMILCDEITETKYHFYSQRNLYKDILRCAEKLYESGESGYTKEDRSLAKKRLQAVGRIDELLNPEEFRKLDLFLISLMLRLLYLVREIRQDCVDTLSNGDVHSDKAFSEMYRTKKDRYAELYDSWMAAERISENNHGKYSEDEISVILQVKTFLYVNETPKKDPREPVRQEISQQEKRLKKIADNMKKTNQLFTQLGDDCLAADYLKCLRTSYERLKKYSEVVECLEVCAECIEHIAEINQKLENIGDAKFDNVKAESGIKALLGFSLPGADQFDVFLSYKHEDGDIARSIYHFLNSNLIHPFFDSITLPEMSDSDYEEAIMQALEHSHHFIVVFTDLKYLESFWVKLEMKTFHHEMVEGRKEGANFLMIVTDEVFEKIRSSNKMCLPIQYRSCEIMRITEYRNSIIQYLR